MPNDELPCEPETPPGAAIAAAASVRDEAMTTPKVDLIFISVPFLCSYERGAAIEFPLRAAMNCARLIRRFWGGPIQGGTNCRNGNYREAVVVRWTSASYFAVRSFTLAM